MTWAVLASALVLGLLGSPHCGAMCGPIVAASSVGRRRLPLTRSAGVVAAQNAGRLASYALAGALAGGIGDMLGTVLAARARSLAEAAAALVLVAAGLALAGLVPARVSLERIGAPVWRRVQPVARRLLPVDTPPRALAFGLLWGLVPCGLVYSALSLAVVSGGIARGAAVMVAFGAGTAPAMLAIGVTVDAIAKLARRPRVRVAAGALVALLGVTQLALAARSATAVERRCCHARGSEVAHHP
jgi:hypothetical protein